MNIKKAHFKKDITENRKLLVIFILIILLLNIFLYVHQISKRPIGPDEGNVIHIATKNILEIPEYLKNDAHPPLFYILYYILFRVVDVNFFTMHLISATAGTLFIFLGILIIQKLFNTKTAFIFGIITTLSPYLLQISNEIRPYSTMALFSLLLFYIYIQILDKPYRKINFGLFFIFSFLSIITHNYGFILVFLIYFLIILAYLSKKLDIKKIITFFLLGICLCIVYIPFIGLTIQQFKNVSEERNISAISNIMYYIANGINNFLRLSSGFTIQNLQEIYNGIFNIEKVLAISLITLLFFSLWLIGISRIRKEFSIFFIMGFIITNFLVTDARYMSFLFFPYSAILSVGLSKNIPFTFSNFRKLEFLPIFFILIIFIISIFYFYSDYYSFNTTELNNAAVYLNKISKQGDTILLFCGGINGATNFTFHLYYTGNAKVIDLFKNLSVGEIKMNKNPFDTFGSRISQYLKSNGTVYLVYPIAWQINTTKFAIEKNKNFKDYAVAKLRKA